MSDYPETKYIQVHNGRKIAYCEYGDPGEERGLAHAHQLAQARPLAQGAIQSREVEGRIADRVVAEVDDAGEALVVIVHEDVVTVHVVVDEHPLLDGLTHGKQLIEEVLRDRDLMISELRVYEPARVSLVVLDPPAEGRAIYT